MRYNISNRNRRSNRANSTRRSLQQSQDPKLVLSYYTRTQNISCHCCTGCQLKRALYRTLLSQINTTVNPLVKSDMAFMLSTFVQDDDYVFFALVCGAWSKIWDQQQRDKTTRAVKPTSTVRQLSYCFSLGLFASARVTTAAASIGRIDLIATGRVNGCPLRGYFDMMAACRGGHLATVAV